MPGYINPIQPMNGQLEIQFDHYGKEACRPGKYWGPGIRDHYKIVYIHDGRGQVTTEGKTYELERGQGFVIFPNHIVMYKADETEPWTHSWLAFKGVKAEGYFHRAGLSANQPLFDDRGRFWFEDMFDQLKEARESEKTYDIRIQSILYRALAELVEIGESESRSPKAGSPKDAYVRKAVSYIEMNFSGKISISALADNIGVDRKYLSALFKETVSLSPQTYILQYRMHKACELLRKGDLTISDVSRSVGYEDPLLFSKMFKRIVGQAPKAYRDNLVLRINA